MSRSDYIPSPTEPRSKRSENILPHSVLAEQALLGACLCPTLSGPRSEVQRLALVREQFAGEGESPFYDLRHQVVFRFMCDVADSRGALDTILLFEALQSAQQLEACGGISYISSLGDVGMPHMLEYYLEGVWEKHLARQIVLNATSVASAVQDINGVNETLLGRLMGLHEEFMRKTQRGAITPEHLQPASAFGERAMEHFFGAAREEAPGHEWPFPFPHRFRRREATLIFGDDGSGKSTVLSYLILHLLQHPGEKAVMASFEVPPEITLWIMAAQLLGRKAFTECDAHRQTIGTALAWLNARLVLYDFQGIASWREVRDTFRYAAEKQGATLFTVDNLMRTGIADDDYAQQALYASTMHQFAEDHHGHVFNVLHENAGDGKGKQKIRGSKLLSANHNNVIRIRRNADKQEKIDKAEFNRSLAQAQGNEAGVRDEEKDIARLSAEWDTEIVLHKQRYPGTRQNGSKRVWFDPFSFQLRHEYSATAVNWLERWKARNAELSDRRDERKET